MLAVNPATGQLTVLGQKNTGSFPNAVEFGPNSRTMFIGVATDNSAEPVSSLGNLTQLGTPSTLVEGPTALDFNSAGTRLAVATYGGVQMYAVGNVGLTARPFKPFTGGESGVAFNPSGHLLAVSLQDSNRIRMFSVASNGSLTSIGTPAATGSEPDAIAFSPSGKLLAVANQGADTVSMFSVNASTGALTARGTPASTGASPSGVAFSPTGRLLATSNNGGHTLSLFALNNRTAGLAPASGSPLSVGIGSFPDAVARSGRIGDQVLSRLRVERQADRCLRSGKHRFSVAARSRDGLRVRIAVSYFVG
jgi:6-phosphogluconolactonase